jgi:hypothetical protein
MMRSFMTSGFLTWGTKIGEVPDGSHTPPFPEENDIMTIYGGCPPPGMHHVSSLSPGPQLTAVGDTGAQGCNDTSFPLP